MVWIIISAALIATLVLFLRPKSSQSSSATLHQTTRAAQTRAIDLPPEERGRLASEIRASALDEYDRIGEAARRAGKDESFAHQAGVLQALSAITAPGRQLTPHDQRELQMETVPFNKAPPAEGRIAIAEYAVWKFFAAEADVNLFAPALRRFRDEIYNDENVSSDVTYGLLYSMKYDWQRWLSDHRTASDPA
ncbi:hypothetical protein [Sphingomonas sp.]|uniref:hypothetical protein n=1 Tax=Sphingomonas sp. TaxID=28214 RepID=UPI002E340F7B|nr:hypothetical protein [Sphingomonas sp.]HEX4695147.1 hypothetical protein [Sphingomonas sp.]